MSDFHQGGAITTLHRLGPPDAKRLEDDLLGLSRSHPIALVLPCLSSELHGPGLAGIVDTLRSVHYLRQIVVSISGVDDERGEYEDIRALFEGVETVDGSPPILLWNSGPRVKALYQRLEAEGLEPGAGGKGRSTADSDCQRAGAPPRGFRTPD